MRWHSQAVEALFAPKRQITEPSVSDSLPSTDRSDGSPPAPIRLEEVKASVGLVSQATRGIPRSQFARIRALAKYGMTVAQVAEVYGAAVGEIERIIRKA
jgi:hypothetical protein